ncbi:uncharacterized protein BDZ99DRAFT_469385 [Mytilinidion resinicola]|uniref:F-box domain-containing protein n=1 Tax=Mytilinidion resinicola TaxID=574789 RepID=A0A6A6Y1J7_9PEZI|nr:uncharacterized protein BDZ99DRAFT_469385 [Mytilinidion resinicola]KAF2801884.1 hypothetical protein BDZ99DRAFT_469385 [Mytilinidion resinicola]
MASTLNIYRVPGRTLSILPCASIEGGCELHRFGRNQPCLEAATSTEIPSNPPATTASVLLPKLSKRSSTFLRLSSPTVASLRIPWITLRSTKTSQNADAKIPPLLTLPVELLQAISLLLPNSSFVSLTLTCTALATALGTRLWTSLTKSKYLNDPDGEEEYHSLLILLQRDRPSYRLCKPCGTIHSPRHSTISIPRNVLTKRDAPPSIIRRTALFFLEPGLWAGFSYLIKGNRIEVAADITGRTRRPAYWLSHAHIESATAKRICLATLSCKAKYAMPLTLYDDSLDDMDSGSLDTTLEFEYEVTPLRGRRNILLFQTTFTFRFVTKDADNPEQRRLDTVGKQHEASIFYFMSQCVDMRPCVHAPSDLLIDEAMCLLFHQTMGSPHRACLVCDRAVAAHEELNGSGSGPNEAPIGTVVVSNAAAPNNVAPNAVATTSTTPPAASPASDVVETSPIELGTSGISKGQLRWESQRRSKQEDWYAHRSCDCIQDFELSVTDGAPQNGEPNHRIENVEVKIWNMFGERPGERDAAIRQPGMLRQLWYDEQWSDLY